jgi:hypothetical protein
MEPECSLLCPQKSSKVSILSQINPVHTIPFCLFYIYFNIIPRLDLGLPSSFFRLAFPPKCFTLKNKLTYTVVKAVVEGIDH